MADIDLRRLEREVAIDPSDVEATSKLVTARGRIGEKIEVYWKIRHQDGSFCSGNLTCTQYNRKAFFTNMGKIWRDKTELHLFVKKAAERRFIGPRAQSLSDLLKESEIIEYRTIEFETTPLEKVLKQAELEILRAEKADLEKLLAEKAELLAQKELTP